MPITTPCPPRGAVFVWRAKGKGWGAIAASSGRDYACFECRRKSAIRVKTEAKCMNSRPLFGSWSRFWNKDEARLGSHETWVWFTYSKRRNAWTRVSLSITNLLICHPRLWSLKRKYLRTVSPICYLALFCVRREVERGWVSCKWFRLRLSKQRCNWTEIRKW